MSPKVRLALALGLILVFLVSGLAQAQETNNDGEVRGSIRGKVAEDRNGDGRCDGPEDAAVVGIPIEFTSADGQHTLFLQSGDDGTYGLVAAGLGTWTVTLRPPENYVATSNPVQQVTLTTEQRLVLGVDFCVRQRGIPGGPGGGPGGPGGPGGGPGGPGGPGHGGPMWPSHPYHPPVLLPESGAPGIGAAAQSTPTVVTGLWVAGLLGVLFVGLGLVMAGRNRISKTTVSANQDY